MDSFIKNYIERKISTCVHSWYPNSVFTSFVYAWKSSAQKVYQTNEKRLLEITIQTKPLAINLVKAVEKKILNTSAFSTESEFKQYDLESYFNDINPAFPMFWM